MPMARKHSRLLRLEKHPTVMFVVHNSHLLQVVLKAVSYEEYFRQIFGLSGSKKIVENIPRKYYLGNMGSVLRFRNIFFSF